MRPTRSKLPARQDESRLTSTPVALTGVVAPPGFEHYDVQWGEGEFPIHLELVEWSAQQYRGKRPAHAVGYPRPAARRLNRARNSVLARRVTTRCDGAIGEVMQQALTDDPKRQDLWLFALLLTIYLLTYSGVLHSVDELSTIRGHRQHRGRHRVFDATDGVGSTAHAAAKHCRRRWQSLFQEKSWHLVVGPAFLCLGQDSKVWAPSRWRCWPTPL